MKRKISKTVLVVEDEPLLRDLMAYYLESKGFRVFSAENGQDGFQIVQANAVDLIISDLHMPGGDGLELLDHVKQVNHSCPVILTTGFSDLTLEDAYNYGAEAIFAKPINLKGLNEAIRRALVPKEYLWAEKAKAKTIESNLQLPFVDMTEALQLDRIHLGTGGMFVSLTDGFPKIGSIVSFEFQQHEDDFLDLPLLQGLGIIRWTRRTVREGCAPGCGIEFLSMTSTLRDEVNSLTTNLECKSFIPKS